MRPEPPRRIATRLEVVAVELPSEDSTRLGCTRCGEPLDLHQPDDQSPDRLIGICEVCRRWFLISKVRDVSRAVMVLLPEGEWLLHRPRLDRPSKSVENPEAYSGLRRFDFSKLRWWRFPARRSGGR